jgi:hypothetical protein
VLHTIGEETEEDKETQVKPVKKSLLYRRLNYCYDNFYRAFFKQDDYGDYDDFKDATYEDEGIYEDVDTSRNWNVLDVIQEESDSDYYRSLDYCNLVLRKNEPIQTDLDTETLLSNCESYLKDDKLDKNNANNQPKLQPKLQPKSISDKIYNFKKDFTNHDYANMNFDDKHVYENIHLDRKSKNDLLREQFFASNLNEKNNVNDRFNRYNDAKKIECHSIRNDVTKTGPDVKVSGSLNMKLLNLDKYNRILTTTETFMENAEASFTKHQITKNNDFETFIKRSEKYYTEECRDRQTTVELNNATDGRGKTEVRIFYNPTFRSTGERNIRGFCQFCKRRCPRTELKCCPRCVCLELELKMIWKENWLNILLILGILFVLLALLVQCVLPKDVCEAPSDSGEKCFEMI